MEAEATIVPLVAWTGLYIKTGPCAAAMRDSLVRCSSGAGASNHYFASRKAIRGGEVRLIGLCEIGDEAGELPMFRKSVDVSQKDQVSSALDTPEVRYIKGEARWWATSTVERCRVDRE